MFLRPVLLLTFLLLLTGLDQSEASMCAVGKLEEAKGRCGKQHGGVCLKKVSHCTDMNYHSMVSKRQERGIVG